VSPCELIAKYEERSAPERRVVVRRQLWLNRVKQYCFAVGGFHEPILQYAEREWLKSD
jgi:hypothetical protein